MRKVGLFFGVLLLSVFLCTPVLAVPVQWATGDGGNGHWYDIVVVTSDWDEAQADAESRLLFGHTGHLVTLTSQEENTWVWNQFSTNGYWIGAYQTSLDNEPAGNWAWVTGEDWNFTNWHSGEPNNTSGNEHHADIGYYVGEWNDIDSGWPWGIHNGYYIEWDTPAPVPEPATIILLGSGLLGLAGAKRKKILAL